MADKIYKDLCQKFANRGGRYPGVDIPEFYEMATELFTPEEAAVAIAIPGGFSTAGQIAEGMGKKEDEAESLLQTMSDKGLCISSNMGGTISYALPPFVPGIFEFQFMRGTSTDKDRRLAKLIYNYKEAVDSTQGPPKITFPADRVITIDRVVKAGNMVHTYDQMSTYIEKYDPISVSTCFCRHEAQLIDENDTCGKPNDVCMQFGQGAQFVIEKGMGRKVSKEEAVEVLKRSEEAGLVHCSSNRQEIDFVCNCCADHCMILKTALVQPKPGLALNSGFQPLFDADRCTACETCIDNCPGTALTLGENDVPVVNLDRCFGCGVCATGCPSDAVGMVVRAEFPEPPLDRKALKEAIKASHV